MVKKLLFIVFLDCIKISRWLIFLQNLNAIFINIMKYKIIQIIILDSVTSINDNIIDIMILAYIYCLI